ncbi:MAG: hypothetical protein MN733_18995, partial [Nitrososphaera sp.]|nr:hypothetical protein [Nitrososphaera sp.]
MNKTYCFFFTRSSESKEPELFFSALQKHLPKACPTKFHRHKPEDYIFNQENMPHFVDLWWKGILFWWSGKFDADTRKSYGSAFLGTIHEDTDIVHIFKTDLAPDVDCRAFLIDVSAQLRVDYAFVHALPPTPRIRPIDEMLAGATSKKLQRWLPGVPWAACYGQLYTDFFGKEKLLSLPIHETRELDTGLVYCQLTSQLLDAIEKTALLDERRAAVYDLLGRDAFFDPKQPDVQGRAPEFKKPV